MEVKIQAIHFEVSDRLVDFINKKAERLARRFPTIDTFNVTLKVVKPETAMNKEVMVRVNTTSGEEPFASKVANTFEEAFDITMEAVERRLEKSKETK